MFAYEVESLIASIKYEIKELDPKKNKKERLDLEIALNQINKLYQTYNKSDGKEKTQAYRVLLRYLKVPRLFKLISKYQRLIASFAIIGAMLPLSSCRIKPKEEVAIEQEIIAELCKKHTVTFLDAEGNVLKTELVKNGSRVPKCEAIEKEDYTFLGWYQEEQVYNTWDVVTNDLILTPKYCGPISARKQALEELQKEINKRKSSIKISEVNSARPTLKVTDFRDLFIVVEFANNYEDLFEEIFACLDCVTKDDLMVLSYAPRNITYSEINFFDMTEESDLKKVLDGTKIKSFILGSGNINEEDLEFILNRKKANFTTFSPDFDKFELINKYAIPEEEGSILSITLNEHANNKRIILPQYDLVFIEGSAEAPNAKLICNSSRASINYACSEYLHITCLDDCMVKINLYGSIISEDGFILGLESIPKIIDGISSSPILKELSNVKKIELIIDINKSIFLQKEKDQTFVTDENGNILGEMTPEGFKEINSGRPRTLQK